MCSHPARRSEPAARSATLSPERPARRKRGRACARGARASAVLVFPGAASGRPPAGSPTKMSSAGAAAGRRRRTSRLRWQAPDLSAGCCARPSRRGAGRRAAIEGALVEHRQDGVLRLRLSAGTTTRRGHSTFSSIAFWIVVSSSPRATAARTPWRRRRGGPTDSAPSASRRAARRAGRRRRQVGDHGRRAPAKPKLAAVIGTRAPTAVVTTSISAVASLCQSSSTPNAIASAPRSYARADQPRRRVHLELAQLHSADAALDLHVAQRAAERLAEQLAVVQREQPVEHVLLERQTGHADRRCVQVGLLAERLHALGGGAADWVLGAAEGEPLLQHRPRLAPPVLAHVPAERRADVGEERAARGGEDVPHERADAAQHEAGERERALHVVLAERDDAAHEHHRRREEEAAAHEREHERPERRAGRRLDGRQRGIRQRLDGRRDRRRRARRRAHRRARHRLRRRRRRRLRRRLRRVGGRLDHLRLAEIRSRRRSAAAERNAPIADAVGTGARAPAAASKGRTPTAE